MRSKFSSLPPVVQVIAVAMTLLVLAVWAGAFIYSYNALYAVGAQLGGVARVSWIWPLLLDGQIVAANLGLAYAAALSKPRGMMRCWIAAALVASVGFNVWHAGHNRIHWLIAAVAPITIEGVCFIGVHVLDWTMQALGRPTSWLLPDHQTGIIDSYQGSSPAPLHEVMHRLSEVGAAAVQAPAAWPPAGQFPAGHSPYPQIAANGQLGQGVAATGQPGQPLSGEELKRHIVEAYLAGWTTEAIAATTAQQVSLALIDNGVTVSERTVASVLAEVRARRGLPAATQRPTPQRRQRGSTKAAIARKPRKS